jgi:hypothetical protein
VSERGRVELYCTGRHTHPRRDLAMLIAGQAGPALRFRLKGYPRSNFSGPGKRWGRPVYAGIGGGPNRTRSTNIPCPSCDRSPALSTNSLERLLGSGLSEVDISSLPF